MLTAGMHPNCAMLIDFCNHSPTCSQRHAQQATSSGATPALPTNRFRGNSRLSSQGAHLWPEALMDSTLGRRKSHSRSGYRKGATKPPLAASTWMPTFHPFFLLISPVLRGRPPLTPDAPHR